jgi:hypothetical protein
MPAMEAAIIKYTNTPNQNAPLGPKTRTMTWIVKSVHNSLNGQKAGP